MSNARTNHTNHTNHTNRTDRIASNHHAAMTWIIIGSIIGAGIIII